jgi:transglutaminase-like putative cysteine protease
MLVEIQHLTRYRYSAPIREAVMEARMQPRSSRRQRLVSFDLAVDPRARLYAYTDWLGNTVHHFDLPAPHDQLALAARAVVETVAPDPVPDQVDLEEWRRLEQDDVPEMHFDMLRPSHFARPSPALAGFVESHGLEAPGDPLTRLHRLSAAISGTFDYRPGLTTADSPIEHALQFRSGVCQDFAHIMLAVVRHWGIPARYVSGYLCRTADSHDRSAADASHAWVECWLPSLGWIGFDPTNAMLASERHVVIGVGRDYADVPPTRGVYRGEAESKLEVAVQVRETRSANAGIEFIASVQPGQTRWAVRARAAAAAAQAAQQQQQQQQ